MEHSSLAPVSVSDGPRSTAERLLAAMHSTCSHDLPNQVLSLQSLINLMDMDEAERLDVSGREYLRRLRAVADKTAAMAEFLKSAVRLARVEPKPRDVDLAELFQELRAEAKSVLETPLTWEFRWLVPSVRADYELVYPSLGELLRVLLDAVGPGDDKSVTVTSLPGPHRVMVEMSVGRRITTTVSSPSHTVILEKRTDFVLACERLRIAGVAALLAPRGVVGVSLDFPKALSESK